MHTYEEYNDESQEVNDKKAIQDMKRWFGQEKFAKIVEDFQRDRTIKSCRTVSIYFSIGGVEGYPVAAFIRTYLPHLLEGEDDSNG